MTIDEAIKERQKVIEVQEKLYEEASTNESKEIIKSAIDNDRQLVEWLTELKELREQSQKAKSMILDYSYTVEVMCNKISGTIGCEKCTYYNPETHDCEVRAYIARTRAFVKGGEEQ